MKKLDILKKVKEIQQQVDDRYYTECETEDEWSCHFESILRRIKEITDEVLGKDK